MSAIIPAARVFKFGETARVWRRNLLDSAGAIVSDLTALISIRVVVRRASLPRSDAVVLAHAIDPGDDSELVCDVATEIITTHGLEAGDYRIEVDAEDSDGVHSPEELIRVVEDVG